MSGFSAPLFPFSPFSRVDGPSFFSPHDHTITLLKTSFFPRRLTGRSFQVPPLPQTPYLLVDVSFLLDQFLMEKYSLSFFFPPTILNYAGFKLRVFFSPCAKVFVGCDLLLSCMPRTFSPSFVRLRSAPCRVFPFFRLALPFWTFNDIAFDHPFPSSPPIRGNKNKEGIFLLHECFPPSVRKKTFPPPSPSEPLSTGPPLFGPFPPPIAMRFVFFPC